jgi:arsenate reductase
MADRPYNVLFLCTGNIARSILAKGILRKDAAAGEASPVWLGHPATAHWGIEDPAAVDGSDIDKERAFVQAFKYLKNRISAFLALPMASLDQVALTHHLREIGCLEGATSGTGLPFNCRSA